MKKGLKATQGAASAPLAVEYVAIERLIPYARNSRTRSDEQVAEIAASIREFGWTNPVLVDEGYGLIAGHGRVLAARKLQMLELPVIMLRGLSEAQKRALVIADNQLALNAGWDKDMLAVELQDLKACDFDLGLLGFKASDLESMLSSPKTGLVDDDEAPEAPVVPTTIRGDLWRLGTHLVCCGDSTEKADVAQLMGDSKADLIFTDPPYNVAYTGYTKEKLTIQNDAMTGEQFKVFLSKVFENYASLSKAGASMYVCYTSSEHKNFQESIEVAGWEIRNPIIWVKNTFAWGFGRYKFRHEPIFYCHRKGESDAWYGDKSQNTVWEEKKPAANRLHPTMKPVELIERALVNSSKTGDVVVDLFGGSGSTMIACEKLGRHARSMELDPKYTDVIVTRWQNFTGLTATLEGTTKTFDEIKAERHARTTTTADES